MDWTAAYADFFTVHAGFTTSEGLTIHKGINEAHFGSRLRITAYHFVAQLCSCCPPY